MSVQEMDGKSDKMQVITYNRNIPTKFRNDSHAVKLVEELHSLRQNDSLCDINLVTDDGSIVVGHKNVLVAASPYFRAMFSSFDEMNKNVVNIRELDSTVLEHLVDYIYTGEILITSDNAQVLLPAANILQLDYVSTVCENLIKNQLDPSNCLGIKAFADLHNCTELFSSSEAYIKKYFLELTECDEFLSLSFEEVAKLISCDNIYAPLEEKVFESVIKWVKHELDCRQDLLPKLMEHVRLPLVSRQYILKNVGQEPLLKNSLQCKDHIIEALNFHVLTKEQPFAISETIRTKPRQSSGVQKVILMFGWCDEMKKCYTKWYDPKNHLPRITPEMNKGRSTAGLALIRDRYVFALGGVSNTNSWSVEMLDIVSQSSYWIPTTDMIVSRNKLGVGVLNDCIYAVGGSDGTTVLNSVEVFDLRKWSMVSSMSTKRSRCGIGALNNRLYALGGFDGSDSLKTVECYDPTLNSWTPIVEMSVRRQGVGIGVLDGVLYAVGGFDGASYLRSAEVFRPSDGVWSPIADMLMCRTIPGVVALDGLLYVMGGRNMDNILDSVEIYNPSTNTWSIESLSTDGILIYDGIVVNDHQIL